MHLLNLFVGWALIALPTFTTSDLSADCVPMKKLLLKAFASDDKLACLSLKPSKKNALIDFLSVLPEVATKACTPKNIRHGFIEAGYIDPDKFRYPVFNKILATCRRAIKKDEYENMCETFPHFLQAMVEQGFIPEEYFDLYGIAVDRDMNGDEVVRLATIAQESHQ